MFVSYTFIVFLAILFVLYYLIPKGGQWAFLLAASLLFYGSADVRYLVFIVQRAPPALSEVALSGQSPGGCLADYTQSHR